MTDILISMLRGEIGYFSECSDLAQLGIESYRDAIVGLSYTPYEAEAYPQFAPEVVAWMNQFLRACWEQGLKDREATR